MVYVIDLLDNDEEVNGLILACHDELEMWWTKTNITVTVRACALPESEEELLTLSVAVEAPNLAGR
jgi:hypothetical protein